MVEVKNIRLQTSEEIGTKVNDEKDTILLKKPALILPAGQGRIGLVPYIPYGEIPEDGLEIKKSHVVFIVDPANEFLNEYNSAFGSGLVVAGAGVGMQGPEGPGGSPALKLTQ